MNTKYFLPILVFIVGVVVGIVVDGYILNPDSPLQQARQIRQGGYSLINPLLECEVGEKTLSDRLLSFQYIVEEEVNRLKQSHDIEEMSVYFRDLNTGTSFGINQQDGYSPASLLKLPVMIAYYKEAEKDPGILKKKLRYSSPIDRNSAENIPPDNPIVKGEEYSVEELISRMIVSSDNNAMALLVENLPITVQDQVYTDLGITIPGVRGTEDFMSVREYASFFRILYNASYLSKDASEKALNLLSEVDFADGLRAGVPSGVTVANKFGERGVGEVKQLHDCGIVYYNDHPYLLCVMSRGSDFSKLASSIKDISTVVYREVDKQVRE